MARRPRARAVARGKVLVAMAALVDRIAARALDLGNATKRAELAALNESLAVTRDALSVLDGTDGGMVDVCGDVVDTVTPEYDDPDHGEDSEHEHSDPDAPVYKRPLGFILPR